MSQKLFPKPQPAKPLPEHVWIGRADRSEVGREPFFCGRDFDYQVFRSAIESLAATCVGGGTMIFQGAPGSGKSALMLECMEAVRLSSTPEDPWVAVSLYPETLMSSIDVALSMLIAVNEENARLSKIASDPVAKGLNKLLGAGAKLIEDLSKRGFTLGGVSVGGRPADSGSSATSVSAQTVFREVAPLFEKARIVVFVDEAQNTPVTESTKGVVACLHNPPGKMPLVAAFFGLSDTKQVLRACGLSRLADERVCNLEPLSVTDATNSLRRMLDAYYTGPGEEKAVWANALAELSQGWPQHINRVGVAAGRVLRSNDGRVGQHLLQQALQRGVERKNAYYEGRVEAGSGDIWIYRQLALEAERKDGSMADTVSHRQVEKLVGSAGRMDVDEFVNDALHAGLLAPARGLPGHYKIPIPSLGDYLRSLPVDLPQSV